MSQTETRDLDSEVRHEPAPMPVQFAEEGDSRFLERFIVLAERKRFIFSFTGIAAVIAVVVSLLLPLTFEATTKIMPPQQSQSLSSAMMAQLGPLAALAGPQLGLRNPSDLYADMLRSRTIADDLINDFHLMDVYKLKKMRDCRKRLSDLTDITIAQKDGVISITVTDRDPQRAADLANAYIADLEKLTQTLAVSEAGRRRLFFEREVKATNEDLAKAELGLKQAQETTGMIQLDSQAKAMIESMVTLRAQVAAKEVQIQALRSFESSDNSELKLATDELAAMRVQLRRLERGQNGGSALDLPVGNIPTAGLEYVRKFREVKYRETLLEVLTKQYEIARIDEAKDAAIIQVIDKAVRPQEKTGPRRSLIVLVVTFSAFWVAVLFVLFTDSMKRAKLDPQHADRFQRLKFHLLSR